MIHFHVDGVPIAQPRHRIAARGRYATAYIAKDHPVHVWKKAIRKAAREAMGQAGIEMWGKGIPLALSIVFHLPQAKSNKSLVPTIKPDLDNLEKAFLDACNGLVWHDDSQVVHVRKIKAWAGWQIGTGIDVMIYEIGKQLEGDDE